MNGLKNASRLVSCIAVLALLLGGCGSSGPAAVSAPAQAATSADLAPTQAETASAAAEPTATPTAAPTATPQKYPYQDAALPVEQRVKDLLSRMTLEEKAGQMVQAEVGTVAPAQAAKSFLGAILSGGDSMPGDGRPEAWLALVRKYQDAALKTRLQIPILYGLDATHGNGKATGAVIFPHNIGLGAADSPGLMEQMGEAVASELLATGIGWTFSPCVAVAQDPRWGRAYESFSSDPKLVSALALPYSQGLMKGGALPTAKHYAADGGAQWGTSKITGYSIDQGDARIDEKTLKALHLFPYTAQINAGVPVVMASYSSVNGVKMHADKHLLTDVLKGGMGFKGFVVSDFEGMEQLEGETLGDKVATAVNAGVDMLMEGGMWGMALKSLIEDVNGCKITQERVDDAVSRILTVKFTCGLFDNPYLTTKNSGGFATGEHRALASELVSRSLVLLKNSGGILPFRAGQKIFVAGPAADDLGVQCGGWSQTWQGWSGDNARTDGTTILAGLKQEAAKVGAEILTDPAAVASADAVLLVLGEKPYAEGSGDSPDISLTGVKALDGNKAAMELAAKSGKPVVALIVAGRQLVVTNELAGWKAAVMAYLPGTEGEGVAPVLFGEKNFSGKLPMPWYRSVDDIGNAKAKLLFPVGYGLKYKSPQ